MIFLSAVDEQKVRDRAHAIWQAEGRPEGRHLEHWRQAQSEIEREKEALNGPPASTGAAAAPPQPPKKSPGAA
ncbi:DUF2934 domain-containing protein [Methylocapsa sp. S129]|uniref:DUF2934 domain-containing protein n=1 Tax=Methylocapsa sp. S129 TaxID=1641869 RepID=UPI00131D71A6|nr:DUF2934 domain-containing protein [Methylocapsa sp. S129]